MSVRDFELWVVDTPAFEKIFADRYSPYFLEDYLKNITIVVPVSVYNETISSSLLGENTSGYDAMYNMNRLSDLTRIFGNAMICHNEDTSTYLRNNYLTSEGSVLGIRFVLIPMVSTLHETVEYCTTHIEDMTRHICIEEKITAMEKWPTVRAVYDISKQLSGRYLCDFG